MSMCPCGNPADNKHHLQYRSQGGPDTPDNLIDICRPCHTRLHSEAGDFRIWGSWGGVKTASNPQNWVRNLKQFRAMPEPTLRAWESEYLTGIYAWSHNLAAHKEGLHVA